MKPLVIVGAGGLGREVAALVQTINAEDPKWDLKGFVDDAPDLQGETIQNLPVLGDRDWLARQKDLHYVIAIGTTEPRRSLSATLENAPLQAATLRHPDVQLHPSTSQSEGSVISQGSIPTVSVTVGRHAFINLNCTIGHDTIIEDFSVLHPGVHLSGEVHIGEGVELGTGAVVLPQCSIGANTKVGAGAVVIDDVPPDCTVVGVPAQRTNS